VLVFIISSLSTLHSRQIPIMGMNMSTLNQIQDSGCYMLQPELWPTYDASLNWDAVLGCGCRPPGGLADDWMMLNPFLNPADLNNESIRLSIGDIDLAVDRSTIGRNFQCQFCHGRCGRPWALWSRRGRGLEERLEDIEEQLWESEQEVRCGYRHVGPGSGLGYAGMLGHHARYRPHQGLRRPGGYSLWPAGCILRQSGVNVDLINLGHINLINAPVCQRNRRVTRNRALLQNSRHGH
jgi:hypothetical protein